MERGSTEARITKNVNIKRNLLTKIRRDRRMKGTHKHKEA